MSATIRISQKFLSLRTVALVTYNGLPALSESDRALIEPLALRGISVASVTWDDPQVDWSAFSAVLLRSTWDYHTRVDEFNRWLARVEAAGVRLWNPPAMIRWNIDKVYLRELNEHGIPTPETVFLEQGAGESLAALLARYDWARAVVKPRISASAYQTWSVTPETAVGEQARFAALLAERPLIVQQFNPRIAEGEWSFMFFNGIFSHAVVKKPQIGGMFVQAEKGGKVVSAKPDAPLIAQASNILSVARRITGTLPLYARVDCLLDGTTLHLMELELFEPELFVQPEQSGTERFADAIASVV